MQKEPLSEEAVVKPLSYEQRLLADPEVIQASEVKFQVRSAQLQIEGAINETERKVNSIKNNLEGEKRKPALDISKIISLESELENFEGGLKKLKQLKAELGL